MTKANPFSITIVDDAIESRVLTSSLVRRVMPEAQIRLAADVDELLSMISRHPPDFLISDLYMRNGSAFELLQHFPKSVRRFPVLIMSFEARPDIIQRLKEAGADDFISKPIEPGHFWEKMGRLTGRTLGNIPPPPGEVLSPVLVAARVKISLPVQLLELSERAALVRSQAVILPGAVIEISLEEEVFSARVSACIEEEGRQDSYHVTADWDGDLTMRAAATLRRLVRGL